MKMLCDRCNLLAAYNKPLKAAFVIRTATSENPIPYCDDWGDIMDNIPVVREKVEMLLTGIATMSCFC